MKLLRWLGAAALAISVGGGANAATVKIGVVLPFSGANADLGHQIDKAFDLYIKLHAKDIAPHKVEIIKRDEGPALIRALAAAGVDIHEARWVGTDLEAIFFTETGVVQAPETIHAG